MKKIMRLTESDLIKLVNRIVEEQMDIDDDDEEQIHPSEDILVIMTLMNLHFWVKSK